MFKRIFQRNKKNRKALWFGLGVIILLGPILYLSQKYQPATEAAWYNDNFLFRQRVTIPNTGSADSDKKVKLDVNTADLVEPDTANFNTTDQTFSAGMAKRNGSGSGPFAAGAMVQDKDTLTGSIGTQINSNFYENLDFSQGSIVFWITPESDWDGDSGFHYIFQSGDGGFGLYYISGSFHVKGANSLAGTVSANLTAGTTYNVVLRWDENNTINGSKYVSLSIDDSHNFIGDSFNTWTNSSFGIGNHTSGNRSTDALIEGLTIYRRPLYDGLYGIDVGNGDEIAAIYNSGSGKDPTLTTGSWDVVFALPTNASTGALSTGTGEAWSHPHSSNLLYTSTTNTGGFMMNGTYTSDGWAKEIPQPDNYSNLALWLKADSITGLNDGDTVGTWSDSSGSGNDATQGTESNKPLYKTSILNGKPVVRFDTTDDRMTVSDFVTNHLDNSAYTVFIVMANQESGFGISNTFGGNIPRFYLQSDDYSYDNLSIITWTGSDPQILSFNHDGVDSHQVWKNAQSQGTATQANTNLSESHLNINWKPGGDLKSGDFAEIIIYDEELSESERKDVEGYLAQKYSISLGSSYDVSSLAADEKIFAGGYKVTSDGPNQGIYYSKTVSAGDDWVIRALGHSDGTCDPKVILYDQTNGAEIGSLAGTTSSTRADPDTYIFTGEAPSGSTELRVKLVNTAGSGTCYWHQVEVLDNLVDNPSVEGSYTDESGGGGGTVNVAPSWDENRIETDGTDTLDKETTIVHSGSASQKIIGSSGEGVITSARPFTSGSFYSTGGYWYVSSTGFRFQPNIGTTNPLHSQTGGSSAHGQTSLITSASWSLSVGVNRSSQGSELKAFQRLSSFNGIGYVDDAYVFPLDDVSLTVTPATEANSTESSGLRVDGTDTSVVSASNLTATGGTIKFNYTPRHSAADVAKFGSSTPYIGEFYGDADDYIRLYWSSANTITLAYSMGGTTGSDTYDATGAIAAGTTYKLAITYTGGETMTLSIDDTTQITLSSIPTTFDTAPAAIYWGTDQSGGNQGDATFSGVSVSSGRKLQPDCDDLRVTDINGRLLDYYLDTANGPCNTLSTDVWVLQPTINAGDTINYLYYGNPSASGASVSSQFSQDTFTPTSTPTFGTETKAPQPVMLWRLEEGYGTTAFDGTQNNNDGTISGATWKTGQDCVSSTCLSFDGSNDSITRADDEDLDFASSDSFTISAWFKHTQQSSGTDMLIAKGGNASAGYKLYMEPDGDITFAIDDDSTWSPDDSITSTAATYDDNTWHHVEAVKDGTTGIYLYIDGTQVASDESLSATGSLTNSDAFYVGVDGDGSSNPYNGRIDQITVYPYARSASQVKTEAGVQAGSAGAHGGAAVLGAQNNANLSDGLVGYWKMDESSWNGTSGEVKDASGNGNNGTASCVGSGCSNASITSGKYGNAGDFNPGSQNVASYIDFDVTDDHKISGAMTLSAWVNLESENSWTQNILSRHSCCGATGYDLTVNESEQPVFAIAEASGSRVSVTGSSSLSIGTWYYITGVYVPGEALHVYINGKQDGSNTSGIPSSQYINNEDLQIGMSSVNGQGWDGKIDETRIYNRALSPAEVRQLYNFAPGPVGHWKMDDGVSGSGQTITDASSNGNNGTTAGSNIDCTKPGKFGKACDFNGSDDYVTMGDNFNFERTEAFSGSAWVKRNATGAYHSIVTRSEGSGDFRGWMFVIDSDDKLAMWIRSTIPNKLVETSTTTFTDSDWHHVAFTYDGSSGSNGLKLYVDGIEESTTIVDDNLTTTIQNSINANIGGRNGTSIPFNGQIDDVRIYNYARTQKQIVQDMNAGHPAGGSPISSKVGYWAFDEGQGQTVNDRGFGGNNGTYGDDSSSGSDDPTWTDIESCKVNKCANFDGGDYVEIGDPSDGSLDFGTDSFSVSAWVNHNGFSGQSGVIAAKIHSNATSPGFHININANNRLHSKIADTSSNNVVSTDDSATVASGSWHHVAVVFDRNNDKMYRYIDGKATGTADDISSVTGTISNSSRFAIGARARDGGVEDLLFDGEIDEVKVYNYALTEDEIKLDYNAGSALEAGVLGATEASTLSDGAGDPPVGEWKFDEATGTSAKNTGSDSQGATLQDDTTWGSGRFGSALKFDGDGDSVHFGFDNDDYDIGSGQDFSISAWFKSTSGGGSMLIKRKKLFNNPSVSGYSLFVSSTLGASVSDGTNEVTVNSSATVAGDNKWHHAEFVADRDSSYKLYLDGQLVDTDTTTTPGDLSNDQTMRMGSLSNNLNLNNFTGFIDEIKFYKYARTPAQVAYDYNRGRPVAHWKFDECSGTTVYGTPDGAPNHDTNLNGTITAGGSGDNSGGAGSCDSGNGDEMWDNGSEGKYNGSLDFDGTDDYVSVGDSFDSVFSGEDAKFSISAWIKPSSVMTGNMIVTKHADSNCSEDQRGLLFRLFTDSKLEFFWAIKNNGQYRGVLGSTSITDTSQWYHVVATYDGSIDTNDGLDRVSLYVDGIAESTSLDLNSGALNDIEDNTAHVGIGSRVASDGSACEGDTYFNGQIDDVRIYNYALSPTQVQRLYNGDAALRFGPETGSP